jgi:hypothetical protein
MYDTTLTTQQNETSENKTGHEPPEDDAAASKHVVAL